MLINQDFAQSGAKSLGLIPSARALVFPSMSNQIQESPNRYQQARQTLQETVTKIEGAYAPATIRAYRSNFEFFINYCEAREHDALPCKPTTLAHYIAHLADSNLKSSSIRLATVAVAAIHRINRFEDPAKDPDVILELRRMFRKLGRYQKQAAAINKDILLKLLEVTDQSLRGYRDRALLLTGYDSLCRRSELAALRVEEIANTKTGIGMQIRLRKSKTDQNSNGRWISLSERTRIAINEWLRESKIRSGYLFRGITKYDTPIKDIEGAQISRIYKQLAKKANLDCDLVNHISGHSLRIGSAQDLLNDGASLPMIMTRGRWTKVDTVMRYVENVQLEVSLNTE